MGKRLTDEQVEQYRREGYVSPVTVFGANEAQAYRRKFEESEARFGGLEIGKLVASFRAAARRQNELAAARAIGLQRCR